MKLNNWEEIRLAGWCHQNCIAMSWQEQSDACFIVVFSYRLFWGTEVSRRLSNTQESLVLIRVPFQMTTHLWHIDLVLRKLNYQPCRHLWNTADWQWWKNLRIAFYTILQQATLIQCILCDVRWNRITAQLF